MDNEQLKARRATRDEHRQLLIKNLGIFELRALARELGVESPTTKKRDQLLELILDQIYNNDSTVVKKTNRGRPFKKLTNISEIMSQVTGSDETDYLISRHRPIRYEELVQFAQDVPVFSHVAEETCDFTGVVRATELVSYFIDLTTNTKVFISKTDAEKCKLRAGDLVSAIAKKINADNQFIVVKINKVNGEDPKNNTAECAGPSKPIISTSTLKYGDLSLYEGRRNLIKYQHSLFEDNRFIDFANYCKTNDFSLIALGLETSFEDQIMLSSIENIANLTTAYGTGYDVGFDRVVDAISLAERNIARGKKCVLFVYDIIGLLYSLDQCFVEPERTNGHNTRAIVIAQKLISLGRALENGSSVTVVMTTRPASANDAFLCNELDKVCAKFE